jgi:hypothetical protein
MPAARRRSSTTHHDRRPAAGAARHQAPPARRLAVHLGRRDRPAACALAGLRLVAAGVDHDEVRGAAAHGREHRDRAARRGMGAARMDHRRPDEGGLAGAGHAGHHDDGIGGERQLHASSVPDRDKGRISGA